MSANNKNKISPLKKAEMEFEADVLFQKIYGKWYAFSLVDEDCLMAEIPEEKITQIQKKTSKPKAA